MASHDAIAMKAVLNHEIERIEAGGEPLCGLMQVQLMRKAVDAIHLQGCEIYRLNVEKSRAEAHATQLQQDAPVPATIPGFVNIDEMVRRFLRWKLPDDFSPDGGISVRKTWTGADGKEYPHDPVGTNLLNYDQAKAMVKHMLGIEE